MEGKIMSKLKEKYTPVLNRNLLEGAFAEAMSQILMSLDECRHHAKSDLSIHQHVRALWSITMDESSIPVMLTEGRSAQSLARKHGQYLARIKSMRLEMFKLDPNDEKDLAFILKAVTMWIQDAHLILHEDTPEDVRVYLASKGEEEGKEVTGVQ
tara:strand:+ start:5494 stop:5958 length:465 start_codon:yes stop_codon:yes gene_type:complete